ncbi:hypothetical protein HYG77_31645 (plasmid) [Rhodococcus sp. ZPP]|uniref:hypothetical protein n=1 Tax=Rhodococcus sp. ZPP TaxID=2749906 RepID=UPI001AD88050|nr:hypothetical protein [Rhodococcus sp. ZPP]QTJ70150.1 hypothetical protein HYG77_31645 [Rhodococcus sp. ZPP]
MRGHSGRPASLPEKGWRAPELVLEGGTAVRFIEEQSGAEKIYDFAKLAVEPAVQQWLARAFARRIRPPAAVKRIRSATQTYQMVCRFAAVLATSDIPVRDASAVTAQHLIAFHNRYSGLRSQLYYVDALRGILRDDPELPADVRAYLVSTRPTQNRDRSVPSGPTEYTDAQWQQITSMLRRDIRLARDRIRAGRSLLSRYRDAMIAENHDGYPVALQLDLFDRTGEVLRTRRGTPSEALSRLGGIRHIAALLCLTPHEMTAFALLMTAITGENFGTVSGWPATSYRPDGRALDAAGVVLLEATKPRRGPDREHMVTALEDLPPSLAVVLDADTGDRRLFRSPLRVYELLLELTELSRRHGRHQGVFGAYTVSPSRKGEHWTSRPQSFHVGAWAKTNGFPVTSSATSEGPPPINTRWLRNTAIARTRRPVAHTRTTMNDQYLMRSDHVIGDARTVVASALRREVDKARRHHAVPVFTTEFVSLARADPQAAARQAALPIPAVSALVSGHHDTLLAGCTDHTNSPHTEVGIPCPASFLECLDCVNARALPHHLPVQIAAADQIAALRPHLDPQMWAAKYAPVLDRLNDILGHYTSAEQDRARTEVTGEQRRLVEQMLDGQWDLR